MAPCERACRLSTSSELWACASWEVGGRKLGELPGHPGPDGVAERHLGYLKGRVKLTGEPTNRTSVLDDLNLQLRGVPYFMAEKFSSKYSIAVGCCKKCSADLLFSVDPCGRDSQTI